MIQHDKTGLGGVQTCPKSIIDDPTEAKNKKLKISVNLLSTRAIICIYNDDKIASKCNLHRPNAGEKICYKIDLKSRSSVGV